MRLRRPLTVSTLVAAVVAATALPAGAHPSFTEEGASVPAGSLTTQILAMAHGCGTESDAGGDPTTEVAVEVPEEFSYVEALEVEGYEVTTEGDGPVPEVITWTATDGGVPAPELPIELVVDGEPGDVVFVRVFQGCDGFSYRWVGTPDEPADDPAVRLTLTDPDPDAPPPPTPTDPPVTADEPEEGDEPAADEPADEDGQAGTDDEVTSVEDLPTEPPEDEGGGFGWLPIVLGAIVLAALGGLLGARRRPVHDPTAHDDAGTAPPSDDR
jgi:uncharacterized protein YcnI